jgi:hypothetical protein
MPETQGTTSGGGYKEAGAWWKKTATEAEGKAGDAGGEGEDGNPTSEGQRKKDGAEVGRRAVPVEEV